MKKIQRIDREAILRSFFELFSFPSFEQICMGLKLVCVKPLGMNGNRIQIKGYSLAAVEFSLHVLLFC